MVPPVDIVFNPNFDYLNLLFIAVALGLILERRVRIFHLGPPCLSFSMAVNRFAMYAMRSATGPDGFTNLPDHRALNVRLGYALALVAVRFAEAQTKAGQFGEMASNISFVSRVLFYQISPQHILCFLASGGFWFLVVSGFWWFLVSTGFWFLLVSGFWWFLVSCGFLWFLASDGF